MTTNQQVQYIDHMGSDLTVVRAARVSFAQEVSGFLNAGALTDYEGVVYQGYKGCKVLSEKDAGLIKFLATHHHWTPFAHTAITLRMKAPVPIRTQCFKHKVGFVENEESRRYIKSTPEYYLPIWRKSVENKKQGSGEELVGYMQASENREYIEHMERSIRSYELAIGRGVCEEQARFYLPQGCVVNWYWTGSLSAYARFAKQRLDLHAQVEIQELAKMVSDIIEPLFPVSWKVLTGA